MLDILAITSPIFMIIAIGYFAVYRNIVPQNIVRGMGAFVMNFALPCLLIRALGQRDLTEIIEPVYLLADRFASGVCIWLFLCLESCRQKSGQCHLARPWHVDVQ